MSEQGSTQQTEQIAFIAEIKSTKQTKRVSLDNVYTLILETDDPRILDLGKLPPDVTVRVKVEVND